MTPEEARRHAMFYEQRMKACGPDRTWASVYALGRMASMSGAYGALMAFTAPTPEQIAALRPGMFLVGGDWPDPTKDAPPELWRQEELMAYRLGPWSRQQRRLPPPSTPKEPA